MHHPPRGRELFRGWIPLIGLLLALLPLAGCGGRGPYPVEGKIVVKDDAFPVKDLEGYLVMFESETEPVVSASGTVEADGTFRVGTNKMDDGAVAGKHRVTLTVPMAEEGRRRPKKVLPARYESFKTSGLEVTVEPRKNQITLEVEALPRSGGRDSLSMTPQGKKTGRSSFPRKHRSLLRSSFLVRAWRLPGSGNNRCQEPIDSWPSIGS